MSSFIWANNVQTTLAAAVTSPSQTTITLASSSNLPNPTGGQILALTLTDAATQEVVEVMYCTAISGASCTVNRGQEGTTATTWKIGDIVMAAVTAGQLSDLLQTSNQVPFGGRLTLTSGVPVLTGNVPNAGTIYVTPDKSTSAGAIPGLTTFSETELILNASQHLSGHVYDAFGWDNSGTFAVGAGPAWTNSTTRSAAISHSGGPYFNTATITLTNNGSSFPSIAPGAAMYLGSFYCNGNAEVSFIPNPTPADPGATALIGLFNAFNRRPVTATMIDTITGYCVATTNTPEEYNTSATDNVTWIQGLAEDSSLFSISVGISLNYSEASAASIFLEINGASGPTTPFVCGVQTTATTNAVYDQQVSAQGAVPPTLGLNVAQLYADATFSSSAGVNIGGGGIWGGHGTIVGELTW